MTPAKFTPPKWSAILERDRLMNRLASWDSRKLVLIHGPAGQGKSTLAAAYAQTRRTSTVWLTLDATDQDPASFLASLGHAVRLAYPHRIPKLPSLGVHRYAETPAAAVETWLKQVVAVLNEGLFIFDDFPAGHAPSPLADVIEQLLNGTPPDVRFMILSRSQPDLGTVKLRAQRAIGELGGEELRFTTAETAELFNLVFGMPISAAESAHLNRVTEGWAAGLVLVHEYLSSSQAQLSTVLSSARWQGLFRERIFEYLAQEVFSQLPAPLQDFLLRTSVTDHLPLPLAAKLSGLPAGRGPGTVDSMLRELKRRNLFVSSSAGENAAVRYHALFREFLEKRLVISAERKVIGRLQDTAASYFLGSGEHVRAIDLYIGAGRFDKAVPLIERSGKDLIAQGKTMTLQRLIDALPPAAKDRPWLLLYRAVACRFTDPRSALLLADRALASFRSLRHREGQMLSLCVVIEACFYSGGDFRRMEHASDQAQTLLASKARVSAATRARLLLALGTATLFTGHLDRGIEVLQQARGRFQSLGDHFHQVSCAVYLTTCALYRGDLALAQDAVNRGLLAQRRIPEDRDGESILHLVRAMTELFHGNFMAAETALDSCRRLVNAAHLEAIDLLLLEIGGWLKLAQGHPRDAEILLTDCIRRGDLGGKQFFSVSASHLLSLVYLFQRRFAEAKRQSDRALSVGPPGQSRLFRGIYLIVSGAIHGELDKTAAAERDLTEAIRLLRACGAKQQEANAHLMFALLESKRRRHANARQHIDDGFSIGQRLGITYFATLTGEQLRFLASKAIDLDICTSYCRSLMVRCASTGAPPRIRVFCLGDFRVEIEGNLLQDSRWKGKRARVFVKLLASQGNASLTRDQILDALWPTTTSDRLSPLLSGLLHRVRKIFDPSGRKDRADSCILQEGDRFLLNRHMVWTDVGAFLSAVETARRARTEGDQRITLKAFEEAIALYTGDLLPHDAYDDWTIPVREQLRRIFTEAIDRAAEISESLGEQDSSRVLYERMFSIDPCHDHACRWLMNRHLSEGHRHKAVRIYECHELAVRKELDCDPDEQTKKLYRNIIGG